MTVSQNILCIDAGFRNTGYAVWNSGKKRFVRAGYISVPRADDQLVIHDSLRVVRLLSSRLTELIQTYSPRLVLAELPTGASRSSRASACMAIATAIVATTCHLCSLKLHVIRPKEIKNWVGYNGRKSVPKELVIQRVSQEFGSKLLPNDGKREHVADAMACFGVYRSVYGKNNPSDLR